MTPVESVSKLRQYYAVQHMVDTGDLIEWRSPTIIGGAIRFVTRNRVNHSSLVVRRQYACTERRFIVEALVTGLELQLLSRRLEEHSGEVWWSHLRPDFAHLREPIEIWAIDQLAGNRGYDYGSLLRQLMGRVNRDVRRFFCSEFYDEMLVQHGIAQPDPCGARRPGDFSLLGIFDRAEQIL